MRRHHWIAGAAGSLLALAVAGSGLAFDMTGTWEGQQTCTSFRAGAKNTFTVGTKILPSTLLIRQTGTTLALNLDGRLYNGLTIDAAKKPADKGSAGVIHCGTNDALSEAGFFDEIARMDVTTKPPKDNEKTSGTIKGQSTFSESGAVDVGTCKWSYKRTARSPGFFVDLGCPQ
jgi:hypothetical protein